MATPGVPDRLRVTEIQRTPRTEPPEEPTPASGPSIVVQGHGWKTTIPIAFLVAVCSLFIGRQTAPSPDAQQLTVMQAEMRADVAEIKRDLAAVREQLGQRNDALSNRVLILETRVASKP